jgi:hypothetical protein
VDGTGSGSCLVAGLGISGDEPSGSAITVSVMWILGSYILRNGGGWNWLRIMSNGGLWY